MDPIRSLADQGKDQVNERAAAILAPVALTRRPGAREGAGAGPAGMGEVAFSRRRLISYGDALTHPGAADDLGLE
jgi:hypothetical protein